MNKEGEVTRKLRQKFFIKGETQGYLSENASVLLAVSGGVDSMVLLDLMVEAQKKWNFFLEVIHINHQLREESVQEKAYLKEYCHLHQLPLIIETWEKPAKKAIETAAREFRYQMFDKHMKLANHHCLMTAHHGDDQMETVLMKVLRGGQLGTYAGIKENQPFSSGQLIRPLLEFSKEQLYQYAAEQQLVYFEDHTNQALDIQRNRLRHLVIPQLKKENPKAMSHFQQFSQQIQWADQLISRYMKQILVANVHEEKNAFRFSWKLLETMPREECYYFLYALFEYTVAKTKIVIKEQQIHLIMQQIYQPKGQWQIMLEGGWVLQRIYEEVYLIKNKNKKKEPMEETYPLKPNQRIVLNETEWIGLFTPEKIEKARTIDNWSEFSHELWLSPQQELVVGKQQAGERIALTKKLNKKIARYFIDNKIPTAQRQKAWVVRDENKNIYSLVPFTYSHLSISVETDKIHYILLYKYHEEAIGRRT